MTVTVKTRSSPEENLRECVECKARLLAALPSAKVAVLTLVGAAEGIPLVITGDLLNKMRPLLLAECFLHHAEDAAKLEAMMESHEARH